MNEQEELVLKILSSVKEIQGKTKLMKILHFVCKLIEKKSGKSPFQFENNHYGVYTPQLEPVLEKLETQRFVKIDSPFLSKRQDFSLIREYPKLAFGDVSSEINELVQKLNGYSADDVIAMSYQLFPETTTESKIKPKVNQKIEELFSWLSPQFEENIDDKVIPVVNIDGEKRDIYPQYNDMDMRVHMMKSLGLEKLPEINPNSIDESSGIIGKTSTFFKKYDLEKLLEDARKR